MPTSVPPAAASTNSQQRVARSRSPRRRPRRAPRGTRSGPVASLISDSPWTSSLTRSGTRTEANVATAATASVGRDDRAEHERRRPRQPGDELVRGDRDDRRSSPSRARARAAPSARLSARSSRGEEYQPADSSSGGMKTSSTTCGVELDRRRCPGMKASPSPPSTSTIGYGTPTWSAARTSSTAREQQREEELEVAHGARESRIAAPMLVPPLDADDHVAGPPDAPLELIMYGDFQCPYCTAAQSIVARVRKRLDGRLRFVVPPPAAARGPSGRPARRRGVRGRRRAGRVLGDARRALRQRRAVRAERPGRVAEPDRAGRRALPRRADRRRLRGARRARRRGAPARPAIAATPGVLRQRRPPHRARSTPARWSRRSRPIHVESRARLP